MSQEELINWKKNCRKEALHENYLHNYKAERKPLIIQILDF